MFLKIIKKKNIKQIYKKVLKEKFFTQKNLVKMFSFFCFLISAKIKV